MRRVTVLLIAVAMLAAGCSSGATDSTRLADEAVTATTTSMVTTTVPVPTTAASPVTIMHVGEGITQGGFENSTYRCFLDTMLHDAGVAFDFVGSRQKPVHGTEYPCPTDFDQDHEAWGGACVGGIETDKMTESVEAFQPDVALIQFGGEDVWMKGDPSGTAGRLEAFITGLQAVNPDITLLVATMIPCTTPLPWCTDDYPALNDAIATFGSLSTDESTVLVVDMTTGISTDLLRSNTLEFTDEGNEVMAARWMAALEESGVISTDI